MRTMGEFMRGLLGGREGASGSAEGLTRHRWLGGALEVPFVSRVELVCDPDVLAILRELMPVEIALDENRASSGPSHP